MIDVIERLVGGVQVLTREPENETSPSEANSSRHPQSKSKSADKSAPNSKG
jgi:hypothetical protein